MAVPGPVTVIASALQVRLPVSAGGPAQKDSGALEATAAVTVDGYHGKRLPAGQCHSRRASATERSLSDRDSLAGGLGP